MLPTISQEDEFAVLRLNRPEALNALSFAIIDRLSELVDQVRTMPVRALLMIGAGDKAFCAGADIKELMGRDQASQKRGAQRGQAMMQKIAELPIPSVALVGGYAFGGGLELAMACTFRIASPKAKMGLPEIKLGLIPGYGGTQRLARLIGEARAQEMILSGATIEAERAERWGLVNAIVEGDLLSEGKAFARRFTIYSLPVLSYAKEAVQRSLDNPVVEGLRIEADLSTLAFQTDDASEGMEAFAQKRQAVFKDR
ncbi:MAG: enoyl-CoA hydratase/isomerase family protein [Burkholderiaceae bacterium]|jgi:enoyl-CoA hydratase